MPRGEASLTAESGISNQKIRDSPIDLHNGTISALSVPAAIAIENASFYDEDNTLT